MQDRLYAVSFTILTSRHRMQISSLSLLIVLAFAAVQGRTVEQPKESSVNPDDLNASPCPGNAHILTHFKAFWFLTCMRSVCVKVIGDVKTLYATKKYKKPEEALMHYCGKVVKVGTKEDKVVRNKRLKAFSAGSARPHLLTYPCSATTWKQWKWMLASRLVSGRKLSGSVKNSAERIVMSARFATVYKI